MEKVPDMISTKDLSYFKEIFNLNFIACKKCNSYISAVVNEEIKKLIEKTCMVHNELCHKIIELLG